MIFHLTWHNLHDMPMSSSDEEEAGLDIFAVQSVEEPKEHG